MNTTQQQRAIDSEQALWAQFEAAANEKNAYGRALGYENDWTDEQEATHRRMTAHVNDLHRRAITAAAPLSQSEAHRLRVALGCVFGSWGVSIAHYKDGWLPYRYDTPISVTEARHLALWAFGETLDY